MSGSRRSTSRPKSAAKATSRPPTKPSTPRLSDLARRVVVPQSATSTGWPAVEEKCVDLGLSFRPWQPQVGRIILAKRADGKYAATVGGVGLSIPRQVGKTFLVGAIVFALCLLNPGMTVIWTAHRSKTAEETFLKMKGFARRAKIRPHVLRATSPGGDGVVEFRNGSRILFGAREHGFGRGFDEVDLLIFDEGQILTDNALDDMLPATNQSRMATGALVLFMGTPPKKTDAGEVWLRMRKETLSGEDDETAWIEFGAEPGYTPTPKPDPLTEADWKQVERANPSVPADTPREAILRMRKRLGDDSFVREGLGIYDEDIQANRVNPTRWGRLLTAAPARPRGPWVLTIDVNPSRTLAAVAAVGSGRHGKPVVFIETFADITEVVPFLARQAERRKVAEIALVPTSQAGSLLPDLKKAGLDGKLEKLNSTQLGHACAGIIRGTNDASFEHAGQSALLAAVTAGRTRRQGEAELFIRRDDDELPPLVAASTALYRFGLRRTKPSDFR